MNSAQMTANDNEPAQRADPIGLYAVQTRRDVTLLSPRKVETPPIDWATLLTLGLWACALGGIMAVFFFNMESRFQALAMGFGLWTSLSVAICANTRNWTTLRDTAVMTAIAATMSGLTIVALRAGWPLHVSHIVLAGTLLATVLAMGLRSRVTLFMAQILSVIWVINLPQLLGGPVDTLVWAIPAIWAFQMLVAQDFRSRFHTLLQMALGTAWLSVILWQAAIAGHLSLAMGVTTMFMVGAITYRAGKVAQDKGSPLHANYIGFGWGLAVVSALALQDYLLGSEIVPFYDYSTTSPRGGQGWDLAMALGVLAVGATGLLRFRSGHMSALGVSASLVIAASLPLVIWGEPVWTTLASAKEYDFGLMTGLILGGIILAASAAMAFNGLRRKMAWMTIAGLVAGLATIAISAEILWGDYGLVLIYAISAMFAAMIIAAYAHRNQNPRRTLSSARSPLHQRPVAANV